ncbi:hypothetical protein CXG81DRAFT_11093 [Caulochytrium protostelioides]|uniref:Phospholipase C/P1 nuclease n=1 Tax=Caulochytrium protostelioides TaxID=1555241 RepID=A0A4P9X0C9_9FUNG|nr:phospholipase C/P1 nuclease [Caulochytrium protostelioides]RKP02187.1 hypothetical protein CXG81DRAFT_11093 [Caulochytrium protostelioides]|eukprot:RKP02187.1 hypothetical protein CXG81DRAFT_11093 [Caulochytrium protostelioides]
MLRHAALIAAVFIALYGPHLVIAWGNDGHQIAAMVADHFLSARARSAIDVLLNPKGKQGTRPLATIADIASWADGVKRPGTCWAWTRNYHYIDTNDDVASYQCSYDDSRDCAYMQCLTGAITFFTSKLSPHCAGSSSRSFGTHRFFIVHFVPEIHQPLHVTSRARGGNDIPVRFDGRATNLHAVWDGKMLLKSLRDRHQTTAERAAELIRHLGNLWVHNLSKWNLEIDLAMTNANGNLVVAAQWAAEANQRGCEAVFPLLDDGAHELNHDYYASAEPMLNFFLAQAGYRLAMWLNNAFECQEVE